jgi:hypothetical protein
MWNVSSKVAAAIASFAVCACSSSSSTPSHEGDGGDSGVADAASDDGPLRCAVDSDAGIGSFGPPCYPESAKPSGACGDAVSCAFCSYPDCPAYSDLLGAKTFYQCSCTAGAWDCEVAAQMGSGCLPALSCLGPDGGLAVSCLSNLDISCVVLDGSAEPTCGFVAGADPCGNDSCGPGCTCLDPSVPSCACP